MAEATRYDRLYANEIKTPKLIVTDAALANLEPIDEITGDAPTKAEYNELVGAFNAVLAMFGIE